MTDLLKNLQECVVVAIQSALEEQDGFLGQWDDGTPRFDGTVDVEALAEAAITTLRQRGHMNLGIAGAFADAATQPQK